MTARFNNYIAMNKVWKRFGMDLVIKGLEPPLIP